MLDVNDQSFAFYRVLDTDFISHNVADLTELDLTES